MDAQVNLVDFQFTAKEHYLLEFAHLCCRFYKYYARTDQNFIAEVATPYIDIVLQGLMFARLADTMLIFHDDYAPRQIVRTNDNIWMIKETQTCERIRKAVLQINGRGRNKTFGQ